jgi:hypothetical protein
MRLITKKGEFADIGRLRGAYLEAPDGGAYNLDPGHHDGNDWRPDKLHISELGGCPRATAYRLLGYEEKPRSASSRANRAVMFWAGYRAHFLTYSAMNWAGILVEHEKALDLPEPWTGRCDAIFTPNVEDEVPWLYDLKTVLPNALKYAHELPKPKDALQLGGYWAFGPQPGGAVVEMMDRAGSNSPILCEVDMTVWMPRAVKRMALFEAMLDNMPELPPTLEPVYKGHYSKVRGVSRYELASISLDPDWRCSYCEWHLHSKEGTDRDSLCRPYNEPPVTVAQWKHGALTSVKSGHERGCEEWCAANVTSYQAEEVE